MARLLVVSGQCRPIERCAPNCNPLTVCYFPDDTQARLNAMHRSHFVENSLQEMPDMYAM